MRNLVIDIGNTSAKYGLFEKQQLAEHGYVTGAAALKEAVRLFRPENAIIASVAGGSTAACREQLQLKGTVLELTPQTPLPVTNAYGTPQTLGADRIAGAVGAAFIFPHRNCLVIDAGTAITFDFIDREGNYRGGSIAPGLAMKFRALHTFTGRLPLIERAQDTPLLGQNTQECIQSGVVNGTVAELEGLIARYRQEWQPLTVLLCGGDAAFFETKLKARIFVVPELVLIGLNRILEYNVS